MKIVFMGTPDFAVPTLEKLVKSGFNVPLVITQTDKKQGRGKKVLAHPVKKKALELGIEVFQPKNVNTEDSISKIMSINPDLIVVIAYGQILKEKILNMPKYGCINVHASLLPKYRGAAPINWSIINGEKKTGVTIMYMEKGLDTGDMILKKEIDIKEEDTAGSLHDKLMILGAEALIEAINNMSEGIATREAQDNDKSTYASMMDKKLGHINWNEKSEYIKNLIRGVNPWPGAYFLLDDKKIKIFDVEIVNKFCQSPSGTVVRVNEEGIFVTTMDKCIIIKDMQFPGKKRMKVKDFLKGNDFEVGITLK